MNRDLRACLYSGLSQAFDDPLIELLEKTERNPVLTALGLAATRTKDESFRRVFDRLWESLEEINKRHGKRAIQILKAEHARLFHGPPHGKVSPYEHSYKDGGDLQGNHGSLEREYRDSKLKVSNSFKDLADHVCLELEFMAFLLKEKRDGQATCFWQNHLSGFLPPFVEAVRSESEHLFFRAAVDAMDVFGSIEASLMQKFGNKGPMEGQP